MTSAIPVKAFQDNYIWLIQGQNEGHVAIVDPGDAEPVVQYLQEQQLQVAAILCTHHHWDHVNGIEELLCQNPVPVYGPAAENIAVVSHPVKDGDRVVLDTLGLEFNVMATPGHTSGHIVYFGHGMLFCGDTLFSAGCGRLFEGTAEQMYQSLKKISGLPGDTRVYCAHEYTLSNLAFAKTVEPDNPDTQEYIKRAEDLQNKGTPTLPSTLDLEKKVNPFLRVSESGLQQRVREQTKNTLSSEEDIFAALRRWKDNFRG